MLCVVKRCSSILLMIQSSQRIKRIWLLKRSLSKPLKLPTLIDRHILMHLRTNILGTRTNEAVMGVLLKHMSRPAGDATASENGRIEINGEAHHVVDRGRIEVHVTVEMLLLLHVFLNDARDLIPAC